MFRSVFKRRKDKEKPVEEVRMTDSPATKATKVYDAFKSQAPESIEPFLEKAAPWVVKLCVLLQEMAPLVTVAYDYWAQLVVLLDPYKIDLLLPAFVGIVLCFFGGSFLTLIAAVEAYRMCGYETSLDAMKSIKEDMDVFLEASKKDDAKDEDGNGIADVTEISGAQLAQRKTFLFLRTIDAKKTGVALSGLQAGFLAVIATLKLQFAKALTLGSALAAVLEKPAEVYLVPSLELAMTTQYSQWAAPIIHGIIRSAAVSLAWWLQRVVSAVHSAVRGGNMASKNLCEYATKMGWANIDHNETLLDEVLGYGLAAVGFFFQLSYGFRLPFPLNVLLLPFTVLESILVWVLALN